MGWKWTKFKAQGTRGKFLDAGVYDLRAAVMPVERRYFVAQVFYYQSGYRKEVLERFPDEASAIAWAEQVVEIFIGEYDKAIEAEEERRAELATRLARSLESNGMDTKGARLQGRQILDELVAASEEHGPEPDNYGDRIVQFGIDGDSEMGRYCRQLHADGVTDDDIRWYWNTPDLERRVIERMFDIERLQLFTGHVHRLADQRPGTPIEELGVLAGHEVRKSRPLYGDPADTSVASGQDRPLWSELGGRAEPVALEAIDDPELSAEILSHSSFNAWFRAMNGLS